MNECPRHRGILKIYPSPSAEGPSQVFTGPRRGVGDREAHVLTLQQSPETGTQFRNTCQIIAPPWLLAQAGGSQTGGRRATSARGYCHVPACSNAGGVDGVDLDLVHIHTCTSKRRTPQLSVSERSALARPKDYPGLALPPPTPPSRSVTVDRELPTAAVTAKQSDTHQAPPPSARGTPAQARPPQHQPRFRPG